MDPGEKPGTLGRMLLEIRNNLPIHPVGSDACDTWVLKRQAELDHREAEFAKALIVAKERGPNEEKEATTETLEKSKDQAVEGQGEKAEDKALTPEGLGSLGTDRSS